MTSPAVPALVALTQAANDATFDVGSPVYVAIRAVLSIALVALLGLLTLQMVVLPRVARQAFRGRPTSVEEVSRSTVRWAGTMLWAIGAATLARLVAQHAAFFGTSESWSRSSLEALLLNSSWGRGWWLALGSTVVGLWGTRQVRRGGAFGWQALTLSAVALTVSVAMSGHAAAGSTTPMVLHALHVLGAGGWVGGLAALMLVAVPTVLRSGDENRNSQIAGLVRAFSPAALGFAALLAVTGTVAAWRNLGSVASLVDSPYGRLLMTKLALLAVAAGTGAFNWKWVLPSLGSDTATTRLRRSASVELAAALLVLVVTAVLVATPMPSDMMHVMDSTNRGGAHGSPP